MNSDALPITRRTHPDGTTELAAAGLRFVYQRPRPGVLLMRIHGDDRNQLGDAPFAELDAELARHPALDLFVDTAASPGAISEVREAWTDWLRRNRHRLARVTILAATRYLEVTINVAKLFSRTGDLIRVHSDRGRFEQEIAVAAGRVR